MPSSGASLYSLYPENLYAEHKNQSGPRLYGLFTRRVQRFRSSLSSMIGARTTSHSNSHQDWNGRELVEFFRRVSISGFQKYSSQLPPATGMRPGRCAGGFWIGNGKSLAPYRDCLGNEWTGEANVRAEAVSIGAT
jgi:hypothetical protein